MNCETGDPPPPAALQKLKLTKHHTTQWLKAAFNMSYRTQYPWVDFSFNLLWRSPWSGYRNRKVCLRCLADDCFYYHTFPMTSFISLFACGRRGLCYTLNSDCGSICTSAKFPPQRSSSLCDHGYWSPVPRCHLSLLIDVFIKYFHQWALGGSADAERTQNS